MPEPFASPFMCFAGFVNAGYSQFRELLYNALVRNTQVFFIYLYCIDKVNTYIDSVQLSDSTNMC